MKLPTAILILLGFAASRGAEPLMLHPAQPVNAGAAPLNCGGQVIPCIADWNGDGLPDLVVGYQPAFKLAVYYNSGAASQPILTTFTNIQAGGMDICLPSGGCGSPAPWICDYDDDGKRDLLAGAGADGKVWFYRNTNTDASPVLASGLPLRVSGGELSVGARATPYRHDWDEDGLPDLLCGDANGYVHFFRNIGSRQSPTYTNDVLIQAGGAPLNLGYRSAIRVCDWDGDGVKDLVGSGSDNAAWCKNIGINSSPSLSGPVRLQAPSSGAGLVNIDSGYRMRLEVTDWNQDGMPDLLIGNWDGYIYLHQAYRFLLKGPSAAGSECVLEWNSAPFLSYTVLGGPAPDHVLEILTTNLLSNGKHTCWTNTLTGTSRFFRVQLAR